MANKLSIPSVAAVNTEGVPFGTVVFLQSVEDNFKTLDNNVLYRDAVTVNVPPALITNLTAEGQFFSISGVVIAGGEDYAKSIEDQQKLLEEVKMLRRVVETLVQQVKGT